MPFAQRQNQGQRAGPEGLCQLLGQIRPLHKALGCFDRGDMGDQRVEAGPSLGLVNRCDGLSVAGVAAKAIDRFGRKSDQKTLAQKIGSLRDAAGICRQFLCAG